MDIEILWNSFLSSMKDSIASLSYDTWFKDTYLGKIEENKVTVIVPMQLHKKNLSENYKDLFVKIFNEITVQISILIFF